MNGRGLRVVEQECQPCALHGDLAEVVPFPDPGGLGLGVAEPVRGLIEEAGVEEHPGQIEVGRGAVHVNVESVGAAHEPQGRRQVAGDEGEPAEVVERHEVERVEAVLLGQGRGLFEAGAAGGELVDQLLGQPPVERQDRGGLRR